MRQIAVVISILIMAQFFDFPFNFVESDKITMKFPNSQAKCCVVTPFYFPSAEIQGKKKHITHQF